ncbi:MAG: hypothetical protein HS111_23155 [Kofleriaceae bacterium]|nr:hypothetical protein [Kofleriaceae bacterium]MCL4226487.1 glycogen-binding domain-containing protein [Myxococcales bacterium]
MRRALVVVVLAVLAGCHPPGWDRAPGVDAAVADGGTGDGVAEGDGGAVDGAVDALVTCARTFRLEGHGGAQTAVVTGDFVGWAGTAGDGAIAMALGGDAAWTATHTLAAGIHQYRFVVDDVWMEDPANSDRVPNGLGGYNSLARCP